MSLQQSLEKWRQIPYASCFQRQAPFSRNQPAFLHADLLDRFYPDYPLVPIEFLKSYPDALEATFAEKPADYFLSSGTTERDRSRSPFSRQGLDLYREFSLRSFRAVLSSFFPETVNPPGVSFIPSTREWPHSSLAQMLQWFGEEFPLTYWTPSTPLPERPVWVFATGFHLVAFADAGQRWPLPKGSIVIETGGTKGKTRAVTRAECYELIHQAFGVDKNHIVSEYGMCELASQAYDFASSPNGPELALQDRWFRFPAWAQTRILTPDQSILESGDGSLIVDDRIRIDIGTALRTEDRAVLRSDGAFQLLGRVAYSPLKGCSLRAEDLLLRPAMGESPRPKIDPLLTAASPLDPVRAERIYQLTQAMLSDPRFHSEVTRSLGQEKIVAWWLADLAASVPASPAAWLAAGLQAQNTLGSWLLIPPKTHDFAIMHPLFIAALLNLKCTVRSSGDDYLLDYWARIFEDFWSFDRLGSDWRLEPGQALPAEGLLVFGSDETVHALREATAAPVQGFGSWLTVSVIHRSSWQEEGWVKDAFSFKQQGCMSSRLLIVWDGERPENLPNPRPDLGRLSYSDQLHLAHSELGMAVEGWKVFPRPTADTPVVGYRGWDEAAPWDALLSSRPLTLPVLTVSRRELASLSARLKDNDSFKLVSCDALSQPWATLWAPKVTCAMGTANVAGWTGLHGGRPLFFPESSNGR